MLPRARPPWLAWGGLGVVLLLGAALRIWGVTYGLPNPTARPDEELVVGKAFSVFTAGRLDPGNYTYPSLLIYLQALALWAYAKGGALVGWYAQPKDFLVDAAVARPSLVYLICRSVSVVLGLGTIGAAWLLAWLGCRRRDVAALAALIVATNYIHVRDSRFGTVDVGMTFFIALSLCFAVKAVDGQRAADFALAGLCAGLAASVKYNGGIVLIAPVAAALLARPARVGPAAVKILIAAGAALAAFALTSPYILLRYSIVLGELAARRRFMYGTPGEPALWVHLRETFPVGLGWPLFVAAGLAAAWCLRSRRACHVVVLAYLLPMLASILTTAHAFPRYLVPVVPAVAVLTAEFAVVVLPAGRLTWLALALALAGPGLWRSVAFDRLAAQKDTRVLAAEWVAENLPARSPVGTCKGYAATVINSDFRRPPAFRVSVLDCQDEAVVPDIPRYLITQDHPVLGRWSRISAALAERLKNRGRPLVVLSPFREGAADRARFYAGDAFYLPLSGLDAMVRGGPVVTVWDLGA
jgi:dolichyl-phosphate-mannose-protein mannosyltransferase